MNRNHWPEVLLRDERHFDDRVLRCFAERPPHLPALLAAAEARDPGAPALVDGPRRWNWRALREESTRLAVGLRRLDVKAGDRVVLLAPNRAEFVIATHAVLRLGAVLVPVSMREAGPGIAFILNQCRASVVIADPVMMMLVPPALADGEPLQRVCLPGASASDGWMRWETLLDQPTAGFMDAAPGEEEAAVILYTSGTTGAPKGAVLAHLNLVHSVLHYRHGLGLRAGECGLLAVPGSHVTGLVALILAMAGVGGSVVLLADFKAAASLALVARERVTYTLMVPAMYALWLRDPALRGTDLSSLRLAGFGGAPMAPATIEGLRASCPGIRLFNAYGSTETASPATMTPPGSDVLEAVGKPLPCADIRVMDEQGREVPRGTPGEVWIGGPMVVPRYWDNPKATAEGFAAGYWQSGDIGTLDAEGYLRVHDRKKDMINRGGYKVFSVEVENCLVGHPAVQEAATVGVPCPVLGERIHAFVYAPGASDRGSLRAELVARCRTELADYKTPDGWSWLAEPLPRNANGKVLKRALREQVV
ncbi:class I adenylate-forming enzyme family protein [Ramlibacter monticola]|uniref:Acyl--CoA ligase n=1 Tax=Ramlibacter monticola TaxID=1926872 RepID=A0A937CSX0_9BURK|nr:class I adenylate-forming enzyme family protein [Ramlibacter monticola]MBL0390978.1 acyl--CoA ligase [Ramlibacter monticola]